MGQAESVGQVRLEALRETVRGMLRETVAKRFAEEEGAIPEAEMDALTQMCMMGADLVLGTENPREYMRGISDRLLDYVVRNRDSMDSVRKIVPFFLVEWCHRNGHLRGDWAWKWSSERKGEGNIHYNPKAPLDKVRFPTASDPGPSGT